MNFEEDVLSNARVYTLRVPAGNKWEPERAQSFMAQMVNEFGGRLTFRILGKHSQIAWQVLDLRNQVEASAVIRAVQAAMPEAEVDVEDFAHRPVGEGFERYVALFELGNDWYAPLKAVTELNRIDPLTNLVQGLSGLEPGEELIYTLHLGGPVDDNTRRWGKKQIERSTIHPLQFLSAGGIGDALGKVVVGGTTADRYVPEQQRLFRQKVMYETLVSAYIIVQIDAVTFENIYRLETVNAAIAQMASDLNGFVSSEASAEETWEVKTLEVERRTSTVGLIGAWAEGRDDRWQRLRAVLSLNELATLWHLPHDGFSTPEILWSPGRKAPIPVALVGRTEGVLLGDNVYTGRETPVHLKDDDRDSHMSIVGKTKVGKSTLMHHLVHQDIAAGKGVAVVDPHGRLVRDILRASISDERVDDVVLLDVANESNPPPLNPLAVPEGVPRRSAAGRVLAVLERVYGGLAGTPRVADTLTAALTALWHQERATVRDVVKLFQDIDYRYELLNQLDDIVAEEFWEWFERQSPGQQDQLSYPVEHRMRSFYGNPTLYPMMCHPDALDFRTIIEEGKILLVSLHADEEKVPPREQRLLGAVLVAQLQMAAMKSAEEKPPFYLYIDEAQNFVTTALDEMLSEARKFGLSLVLANQYLRQLEGSTLDAVMGNIGASVIFQVGPDDARVLAPHVKPEFAADDLVNLDLYHAAVKARLEGRNLPAFSLETRPPVDTPDDAGEREREIRERSCELYTPKGRQEVHAWLRARYPRKRFRTSGDDRGESPDDWVVTDGT